MIMPEKCNECLKNMNKEDEPKKLNKETFEEHIEHCGCCDDGEKKK